MASASPQTPTPGPLPPADTADAAGTFPDFFSDLESLFRDIEQLAGIRICFHDHFGFTQLRLPYPRYQHNSAYCLAVKSDVVGARACRKCDIDDVSVEAALHNAPFLRTCHAGVYEAIVPVKSQGKLLGAVFLGQVFDAAAPAPRRTGVPAAIVRQVPRIPGETLLAAARIVTRFLAAHGTIIAALADIQRPSQHGHRKIAEAKILLEDCFMEPVSVGEIARKVGLSVSYFEHLFKKEMNVSFTEWRHNRRIREAMHLLESTSITVREIAERVGFEDPSYFHRLFKTKNHLSPQAYRHRARGISPSV